MGPRKPDTRTVPSLIVDYPSAGELRIRAASASDRCILSAYLDGHIVSQTLFDPRPDHRGVGGPPYVRNKRFPDDRYQADYETDIRIAAPAGRHRVTLSVDEGDWIKVETYTLTGYRPANLVSATIQGVTNGSTALVWIRNTAYDWYHPFRRFPIPAVPESHAILSGLSPGAYRVSQFDTQTGLSTGHYDTRPSSSGNLDLKVPAFDDDAAFRIERQR